MLKKDQKKNIRAVIRKQRQLLSAEVQKKKANQLTKVISKLPEFILSQKIAFYWPHDNEISPIPLLKKAAVMGKDCYLPILDSSKFKLKFVHYKPGDLLKKNRYGILEPVSVTSLSSKANLAALKAPGSSARKKTKPSKHLDLVLVPLVAFDNHGNRLGMGKGYYDRTFKDRSKKVILIGLAYEFQNVQNLNMKGLNNQSLNTYRLPTDHWDIPLAGIATEKGFIRTEKNKGKKMILQKEKKDKTLNKTPQYWLMKSEPDTFSIMDLEKKPKKISSWEGVRNYQARNFMKNHMKLNDKIFFYHSSCEVPGIVGIMKVVKESYPDFTAWDIRSPYFDPKSTPENPRWFMVDVQLVKKFKKIIPLSLLKKQGQLKDCVLLRPGNRLSVMPVTAKEWQAILDLET